MDKKLAKKIDHTLLKADATREQILALCAEAREYDTASVCVNTCWVFTAREALRGTDVKVCCVVGFPLGAMGTPAKAYETAYAVDMGAEEVDMVINIGMAKSGEWTNVKADIEAVVEAAGTADVKVIIETCLLTDEEKVMACRMAKEAGAAFVKTSTGFSTAGAKEEDVRLMRETVGPDMGVKAAGGIRTREDALKMIAAGATRIGASATAKIIAD